jgi:ketol-acid reductoisomerase
VALFYFEEEMQPELLRGTCVAILGYGSQGRAHALNLRDSGIQVVVGQRPGESWKRAEQDGFWPMAVEEAVQQADIVTMALPDVSMREVYAAQIGPHLKAGHTLLFVHGFNIRYGLIQPPGDVDVVLVSPKAVGAKLRSQYATGGSPALIGIHQDVSGNALAHALTYAWNCGCRSPIVATTFKEETETDLFGEQAVLCGGVSALIKASFTTLVEAGYQPEAAYFECVHEIKLIVDLIYEGGLTKMWNSISNTAEWGAQVAGPRVINSESVTAMKDLLRAIQDGSFAQSLVEEHESGSSHLLAGRRADEASDVERVGHALRSMMPFLSK